MYAKRFQINLKRLKSKQLPNEKIGLYAEDLADLLRIAKEEDEGFDVDRKYEKEIMEMTKKKKSLVKVNPTIQEEKVLKKPNVRKEKTSVRTELRKELMHNVKEDVKEEDDQDITQQLLKMTQELKIKSLQISDTIQDDDTVLDQQHGLGEKNVMNTNSQNRRLKKHVEEISFWKQLKILVLGCILFLFTLFIIRIF